MPPNFRSISSSGFCLVIDFISALQTERCGPCSISCFQVAPETALGLLTGVFLREVELDRFEGAFSLLGWEPGYLLPRLRLPGFRLFGGGGLLGGLHPEIVDINARSVAFEVFVDGYGPPSSSRDGIDDHARAGNEVASGEDAVHVGRQSILVDRQGLQTGAFQGAVGREEGEGGRLAHCGNDGVSLSEELRAIEGHGW